MSDVYSFCFINGPVDKPGENQEVLYEVGLAASAWARFEQQFEAQLLHINKLDFSADLHKDHPVSFTKKLSILKKWYKKHRALHEIKDLALDIVSKAWSMSEERNMYLHSILNSYDHNNQVAVFHRILPEGSDNFRLVIHEVPLENIRAFTEKVNHCNEYLWKVSEILFTKEMIVNLEAVNFDASDS